MDENEFDLRDVLIGRKYPVGSVRVWLDEEPWYELDALEKKHAALREDDPQFKRVERDIKAVQKRIEEEAFVVHLRGISPRSGDDIITAALSEIPIKRDMYGREDELRTLERNRLIKEISFSKHIQKVVWPNGKEQAWTDENRLDLARVFIDEGTDSAIDTVDNAIVQLSKKFAEKQAAYANADF